MENLKPSDLINNAILALEKYPDTTVLRGQLWACMKSATIAECKEDLKTNFTKIATLESFFRPDIEALKADQVNIFPGFDVAVKYVPSDIDTQSTINLKNALVGQKHTPTIRIVITKGHETGAWYNNFKGDTFYADAITPAGTAIVRKGAIDEIFSIPAGNYKIEKENLKSFKVKIASNGPDWNLTGYYKPGDIFQVKESGLKSFFFAIGDERPIYKNHCLIIGAEYSA